MTGAELGWNRCRLAGSICRHRRHQRKAFRFQIRRQVAPRLLRAFRLQMQQMPQRPVNVVGGDEASGIGARVGDQFREPALEARRKVEEEEGEVVLRVSHRGFGIIEPKSAIRQKDQNGVFEIAFCFHFPEERNCWIVRHLQSVEITVGPIAAP